MAIINDGGSFTPPPPDAPIEKTAPGSERATPEQIALARAHERELPAFAPKPMNAAQIKALIGKDVDVVDVVPAAPAVRENTSSFKPVDHPLPSKLRRIIRPAVNAPVEATTKIILTDAHAVDADVAAAVAPLAGASAPEPDFEPILPHMKAGSNTDSPARGIPTATADPNKKITGGFGVPGEGPADYFPLDGTELRAVVEQLLDEVYARIQDDLRFSIACTYPRVSARVEVIIEAYGMDKPIVIPRVARAHDKTVLQTARAHAEEIVFVVAQQRTEMTEAGESVTPPNQMRQDVGLEIPRKHRIETPSGGSMWVDRNT